MHLISYDLISLLQQAVSSASSYQLLKYLGHGHNMRVIENKHQRGFKIFFLYFESSIDRNFSCPEESIRKKGKDSSSSVLNNNNSDLNECYYMLFIYIFCFHMYVSCLVKMLCCS